MSNIICDKCVKEEKCEIRDRAIDKINDDDFCCDDDLEWEISIVKCKHFVPK